MLLLISLLKAYAEILVMAMAGRALLRLVLRQKADDNFVYRIFSGIARPWMRLARWVAPRFVADRYMGIIAACIVLVFWVVVATQKTQICTQGDNIDEQACIDVKRGLAR